MPVYLSPIGNGFQFLGSSLVLLNGGLLNTYAAGSSTPQATFTTNIGNVQNANPIQMNSDGRPPAEIWLTGGVAYKFILTDSLANILGTYDNLYGIGDPLAANSNVNGPQLLLNAAGANAITVTAAILPSAYAAGQSWWLTPATTNTSAVTVNIGGLGNRTVSKGKAGGLVALVQSDFIAGNPVLLEDTGSVLVAVNVPTYELGPTITAASTINLDTATGDYSPITGGGTTVTSVQLAPGRLHQLQVTNVSVTSTILFQAGTKFIFPGGTTVTATPGDVVTFRGELSGVVRAVSYYRGLTGGTATKKMVRTVYTTGAGTHSISFGCTRLNVRLIGGGGGGAAAKTNNGATGNDTAFSSLTGLAGVGGTTNGGAGGAGGAAGGGDINIPGGSGGSGSNNGSTNSQGAPGGNGAFGGGAGQSTSDGAGTAAATNSGGGGSGGGDSGSNTSGGGGGAGGYVEGQITEPATSYSYSVGTGGAGGAAGTKAGGAGAQGQIIVDQFFD